MFMNVLVINGHPREGSFSQKAASVYEEAALQAGKQVAVLQLLALDFSLNLSSGYSGNIMEPDLLKARDLIVWADHIVWIYPVWWWSMPALLKGFVDRILVPDFAFKYHKGSVFQEKLLKGKTATLLVTMDGPSWYHRLMMRSTGTFIMRKGILDYCGIRTVQTFIMDHYNHSSDVQKQRWLRKIEQLAQR